VKSTEIKSYDVMQIYGERVQKLISKDDKPLSAKEAKKEDEKIQKLIDKRRNESEGDREKRLRKEEKERDDDRQFVREAAAPTTFGSWIWNPSTDVKTTSSTPIPSRATNRIGKMPKSCPSSAFALGLIKTKSSGGNLTCSASTRFRLEYSCSACIKAHVPSLSRPGSMMESGLQRHVAAKVDFRLALLKNFDVDVDITDRDYKKFRSDTTIIPLGEARAQR